MSSKLNVAYRSDGSIVSASDSTPHLPLPVKREGIKTGAFDIPDQFKNQKVRDYVHLIGVDVAGGQLKVK